MERPPAGLLDRWFRSGEVSGCSRLAGGYLNDVYRIETEDGRYALRVGVATTGVSMVEWELRVLEHLANQGLPVPRPLPAHDGSLLVEQGGRVAVLLTFLEGEQPDRLRREHRLAAARMLARLHRALEDCEMPPRPGWTADDGGARFLADVDWRENRLWSWSTAREQLLAIERAEAPPDLDARELIDEIEHHLDAVGARAAVLRGERLPVQVIHGDYWPGNLRVVDDEVIGVIDWDDTRHDWRALEVGRSAYEFSRGWERGQFEVDDVDEFIDAYVDAGGELLPRERAAFPLLAAACRITETLYDFALDPPATRDEEGWEYLAATLRLLRRLEG
jgi:Ser/Thr protein kinase RdoA (MazF antagonist)